MSIDQEGICRRLQQIVEMFRQKGATTPEKAITIKELGLPPRFNQAMHGRSKFKTNQPIQGAMVVPRIVVVRHFGCVMQVFFLCYQSA